MIDMKFVGMAGFLGAMRRMKQAVPQASITSMRRATEWVRGYIVEYKLSGQVLKRKTERLAGSIDREEYLVGGGVVGRIGSNLKYARIHELGGDIYPKSAPYLQFETGGYWIKTTHVRIPTRPYIMPSLLETSDRVGQILGKKFIAEVAVKGKMLTGVKYG